MKKILFLIFVIIANGTFAHEYYFSFSTIEVDTAAKRIEISLKLSAHDVEHYLSSKDHKVVLEEIKSHPEAKKFMLKWITSNFSLAVNDALQKMNYLGMEVENDDDLLLYFAIDFSPPKTCTFTIRNTVFFDFYPAQQNRINFKWNEFEKNAALNRDLKKITFDYEEKK